MVRKTGTRAPVRSGVELQRTATTRRATRERTCANSMVAAAESTTESLFSVHAAGGPTCTTLAVHKREKLEKGPKAVPASRAKVSPAQPQTPVRSASVPPENSGSRNTPEAADSPPFTPPRGFVSAVQISEQTCAPSLPRDPLCKTTLTVSDH